MSIDSKFIGKKYGPTTYTIGAEKLREYAYAVSGTVPSMGFTGVGAPADLPGVFHDDVAGKKSPHGSIIALPTFCVVFAIAPFGQAVTDPELGIDLVHLVHGEQEFEMFEVVRPGDVMTTTGTIAQIFAKAGKDFIIVHTESKNQHGRVVVKGTWTAIVKH